MESPRRAMNCEKEEICIELEEVVGTDNQIMNRSFSGCQRERERERRGARAKKVRVSLCHFTRSCFSSHAYNVSCSHPLCLFHSLDQPPSRDRPYVPHPRGGSEV